MWVAGVTNGKRKINNIICCSFDWCLLVPFPLLPLTPASIQTSCTCASTPQARPGKYRAPLSFPLLFFSSCVSGSLFANFSGDRCFDVHRRPAYPSQHAVRLVLMSITKTLSLQASTRSYPDLSSYSCLRERPICPPPPFTPPAQCVTCGTISQARTTHICPVVPW